ncbi:E3 ubiquitin-protein ligase RNF181-like [Senna tora]|uniref:RING-type E3 ubiquitin transferase n=1 Tax=Senna tora TaxID=362788 RepID=A0A834TC56_9FABA|nr:E3 ubiquitin-protein ligase RNF181-like [Senna tora]
MHSSHRLLHDSVQDLLRTPGSRKYMNVVDNERRKLRIRIRMILKQRLKARHNINNNHHYQRLLPLIVNVYVPSLNVSVPSLMASGFVEFEEDDNDYYDHEDWFQPSVGPRDSSFEKVIASLNKVEVINCKSVKQCSICLEDFKRGNDVSGTPCKHVFHRDCIVQWLKESHVYPLCRFRMPLVK